MYYHEALSLILPYLRKKVTEQIKSVAFIITYMIGFQMLVLGTPILDSFQIAIGLSLVICVVSLSLWKASSWDLCPSENRSA